jgi:hypothetical protein
MVRMIEEADLVSRNWREQKSVPPNVALLLPSMTMFSSLEAISKAIAVLPAPA